MNTMENLREMAMSLFNQYLLPFEVTSILLLVAMVGAIVLTKQDKGGAKS
jgi:NADH-quinone oxidoreductase subunit J